MIPFCVDHFRRKLFAWLAIISFSLPALNLVYIQIANYVLQPSSRRTYLIDTKIAELNIRPSKSASGNNEVKLQSTIEEVKRRFASLMTDGRFVNKQHSELWYKLLSQVRIVAIRTIDPDQYSIDPKTFDKARLAQVAKQIHTQYQALGIPKTWVRLGVIKLHSKTEGKEIVGTIPLSRSTEQAANGRPWCTVELSPKPQEKYTLAYFKCTQGDRELYEMLHQHLRRYIESRGGSVLYSPQVITYRDQHYMLYPEVVCDMRYTDSAGYVDAHLNILAALELVQECVKQDLVSAQRTLAEDENVSSAGLEESGITMYMIGDQFVDQVNNCTYHSLRIHDTKYHELYRARVFGTSLNSCGAVEIDGKYVVFKVVMIQDALGLNKDSIHLKFVRGFGELLSKALYTKRG
jgi:hypothetical protein